MKTVGIVWDFSHELPIRSPQSKCKARGCENNWKQMRLLSWFSFISNGTQGRPPQGRPLHVAASLVGVVPCGVVPVCRHDMYSYNCSAPPNPLELLLAEPDCHWLDETTLACCVIQAISALWLLPPGLPPPEPLIKK